MSAKTISEFATWDGHRNQKSSKSRFSSTNLDLYSPTLHLNRDPLSDTHVNTRLPNCVDTSSAPSQDVHRQRPVSRLHPNSAPQSSPLSTLSRLSPFSTNSSVHTSRVHVAQPSSQLAGPPPGREIIDLTAEDTDDEVLVTGVLVTRSVNVSEQCSDPGPSRGRSISSGSSPLPTERSLFTPPPPPRKRRRMVMDHIAVPSFPKGLTKSDYRLMSELSAASGISTPITPAVEPTSPNASLAFAQQLKSALDTFFSRKGKGKAREEDVPSSPEVPLKRHSPPASLGRMERQRGELLDESYTIVPIQNEDSCHPLTINDFVVNTRFQFAYAWRRHVARLLHDPTDLEWMSRLNALGIACSGAGLISHNLPHRIPGTAGWVTTEELRDWELAPLESSPPKVKEKGSPTKSFNTAFAKPSSSIDVEVNDPPSTSQPNGPPVASNPAFAPGLSIWNTPQETHPMDVDMTNDMDQYFNGLGDSLSKHSDLPCSHLYPTNAFRPHLWMNSSGSGFPHLNPQLIEKGDNEPFFGIPPSPPPENAEPSFAHGSIPDSPFAPTSFLQPQSNDEFAGPPAGIDSWSFHEEGGSLSQDPASPGHQVPPIALGTIDPSLLGGEQLPVSPPRPKATSAPKAQAKLPEPIVYVRRPMDSSSLPLVSGKRPVQIKFRAREASHAGDDGERDEDETIPSGSKAAASSSVARNRAESPTSHTLDASPLSKRRQVPSLKRREGLFGYESATSHISEAFSDFMPESSKPKPKPKPKLGLKLKLKRKLSSGKDDARSTELERTSCHQCRNTTFRPKMQCSNDPGGRRCGRRFCNRCIMRRYPEITFDQFTASFLCPVCTNTCNCSFCSRARGEEFISMREQNFAECRVQTKVTLVQDVGQTVPHTTSPIPLHKMQRAKAKRASASASAATTPTPEPGSLTERPMFWAHVYGMEGERIGSAFIRHEQMTGTRQHEKSPPPPPKVPTQRKKKAQKREKTGEKPHGPRVFIGEPLKSWRIRAVRDLEPAIDLEKVSGTGNTVANSKGKGKTPQRRFYIGNAAALYEPYARISVPQVASASAIQTPASSRCSSPMLDSDGSLTPLSELETEVDYWPQPAVGECCSWAPPQPPLLVNGMVAVDVDGVSPSAMSSLPCGFENAVVGAGPASAVDPDIGMGVGAGMGLDVGPSLDMAMDLDVNVDVGVGIGGDGGMPAPTGLSQEDVARAIMAAFTALQQPS